MLQKMDAYWRAANYLSVGAEDRMSKAGCSFSEGKKQGFIL
jgi:phosphoketolase